MKILLLPCLFLGVQLLAGCQSKPTEQASVSSTDELYASPSSASDERAYALLPEKGSEDVSQLLHYPPTGSQPVTTNSVKEYFANSQYDWIIQVRPTHSLHRHQVLAQFGPQWLEQHEHPQLYGRATSNGLWTYLAGTDSDSVFSEIAVAWKLFDKRTPTPRPFRADELTAFQQAVTQQAPALSGRISGINYSPAQAAKASQQLADFVTTNDLEATIVLKADTLFEGRAIWDKMRSLGLHWGDMDLFHWENPDTDAGGGDHLFSVFTSTEPGYFLPEHIAKGEIKTTDLIFSFSIPRSHAPQQVLKNMYQAARYCQQKLGGQLLGTDGQPFNLNSELEKCQKVTQNLAQKKLRPGYDDTLYLF
jgi:cell division protein ZipA